MNIKRRIELLTRLGAYLISDDPAWQEAKAKAYAENHWFIREFVDLAAGNISKQFLQRSQLEALVKQYGTPDENKSPKKVGIVMAGNIPMVGFHDLLSVFITGHIAMVKPSSKDDALIRHIAQKLQEWDPEVEQLIVIRERIPNCEAYIATGSNNTAKHFEYYFRNQPSIIRKNRTSVAVLSGNETQQELEALADDVYQYFGLGCRNVTKIYVPRNYDFVPLLQAFRKWDHLSDHNKYKNNYDYNLAMHILNNRYYMSNDSIILVEDPSLFSPISQLHYEVYDNAEALNEALKQNESIQCIVNTGGIRFGEAQLPGLCDYADGVDTIAFLNRGTGD